MPRIIGAEAPAARIPSGTNLPPGWITCQFDPFVPILDTPLPVPAAPFSMQIVPPGTSPPVGQTVTYPYIPIPALGGFLINYITPSVLVDDFELDIHVFDAALDNVLGIQVFGDEAGKQLLPGETNIPAVRDYKIVNQVGIDLGIVINEFGSGVQTEAGGIYAAMCYVVQL